MSLAVVSCKLKVFALKLIMFLKKDLAVNKTCSRTSGAGFFKSEDLLNSL